MTRRTLLQTGLASVAAASLGGADLPSAEIAVFTDHLAGFSYEEVARMFRDLKVAGPDLTVRSGGLVKPERVQEDLPRAMAVFREHGLKIPMITTEILSADDASRTLLETAAKLGIGYYRLGYPRYKDVTRYQETIADARTGWAGLADLGKQLKIRAAVHNHGGDAVGCVTWDALQAMQGIDQDRLGLEFDPAHASIEGAKMGWQIQLQLAKPRIFILAVKDYLWEKTDKGWRTRWVPLGEGMVPWPEVFAAMRNVTFPGPISLHLEYPIGGATKSERYDRSMRAAEQDLGFLRKHLGRTA